MSLESKEWCFRISTAHNPFIEFHLDSHHRQVFNTSHLINFSLAPNPDAAKDKNLPPQQLALNFSTADVLMLGWRLESLADYLRENHVRSIHILPQRYSEMERCLSYVSSIRINPVGKLST